jgi:hypothetical protein
VLTIAGVPTYGNRHTGCLSGSTVLLLALLAAGPVLVVLAFLAVRSLVRGGGRRSAAGVAAVLLALTAYGALGFGGMEAYSDSACSTHTRPGYEGTLIKGTGLWPPGLECRYGSGDTYRSGFDAVWKGLATTALLASTMTLGVMARDQARRRFGWAPISSDVGPSAR